MNLLKQAICFLHTLSGMILFACLPIFFNNITRWSLYAFVTLSVIDYLLNQRYQNNPLFTWAKAPFWACIALFATHALYIPMEENTQYLPLLMESRSAFLAFGIMGVMGTKVPKAKYMAYACIAVCVALILYVLHLGLQHDIFAREDWRINLNYLRHTHIHAHMAFNTFLNVGIAACFWLLKRCRTKPLCILWGLLIGWFYTCVGLSDGRLGFIASNVVVVMGIIYLLHIQHKRWLILTLISFSLIGGVAVLHHPKIKESGKLTENIRYAIYTQCWELYQQAPWVGVGVSTNVNNIAQTFIKSPAIQKDAYLVRACQNTDMMGAHPHNQLLQSSMEHGIIGLFLMSVILLVPLIYITCCKGNIMVAALWIVIIMQLQTEVIRGSLGDMAFCYYLLLTMYYAQQSAKKVTCRMQGHGQLPSTAR